MPHRYMGVASFQIRVYDPVRKDASAFGVAAEIEMDPEQASQVNVALCAAKADIRFFPFTPKTKTVPEKCRHCGAPKTRTEAR